VSDENNGNFVKTFLSVEWKRTKYRPVTSICFWNDGDNERKTGGSVNRQIIRLEGKVPEQ
jgi:hypothetical protein